MGILTTIEEKLMFEALFGLFFADLEISKDIVQNLEKQGLEVHDSKEVNYYPRLHHVRWEKAIVESENVNLLDEKSDEYTLAQKLWVVSMKNQPKKTE